MTKRKTKTKKYLRGTRNRYLGGTKKLPEWKLERTLETHSEVNTVCFSPDEKTLASGSKDNKVRLWNVETGVNTKTLVGHSDYVNSVCFSPDGKTLASGGNDIRLWNVETGENTKTLKGNNSVYSVCFSPDGKTVASADWTVHLWDVATGENTKKLEGHRDYVNSVCFSPDGNTLASGSRDHTVRLWDLKTGENIKTLKDVWDVKSVSFLPDGKTLVSGGNDIRLWDVSFLLDEKTLLSESTNIRLWDEKKDKVFKHKLNESMSLSPDGKKLLYGIFSSDIVDTNWYMLDLEKGDVISGETRGYYIGPVCFNTDGKKFAVTMNKGIQIWKHDIKAMIRNRLIETKGWDHKKFIQELDPNLMDSAELKELDEYHPDNFLDKIMPKLSEATRTKFNLTLRTPKQTPTTKKKKGNVKPLVESDCKKLDAMYRKYENDLDKLTIVRKKVNGLFKDIKNDKKFNIRRKVTSKNSMPPQRKTRKATLPHASI
jgi:WD40 repeat protein